MGQVNNRWSIFTGMAFLLYVFSCGLEEFSFPRILHGIPNRSMFYLLYEILLRKKHNFKL